MEFIGLSGADFDFFKKKDKITKEEYEKGRNDVKSHFRGLCYELQKIYHKNTGGVLELQKDFQNFNKKSISIAAEYITGVENSNVEILMNAESAGIVLSLFSLNSQTAEWALNIVKNKRNDVWEYLLGDKNSSIRIEFNTKSKKNNEIKLSSLEINKKNYDNLISFIEKNIADGKYEFKLHIGCSFSKNECIKQNKAFSNTAYAAVMSTLRLKDSIL